MVSRKGQARVWLQDCPPDKVFWCHDGREMKNLDELAVALTEMSDDTYRYHVTSDKSDFTNWVGDVIGDAILAKELLKAADRPDAARKVQVRLDWLRKRR